MEKYLVGGAVRDELLGLPVKERDWVVVGATPEEMESRGFRAVGRDFPVFIDPDTGEEHALARTERKTGPGYRGFEVHASPDVTLEQDLARRDLTINAIARDEQGRIIDPWGGLADLESRTLRHVSPAFEEDPVRILRAARFAARFDGLGFRLAPETLALMASMVVAGEADALVPERVWQETLRALETDHPEVFLETLRACGALAAIFPELDALFGVPQPERWHPEIDTGRHLLMCMRQAARLTDDPEIRFAVMTHDLGKGTTPKAILPAHHGHEHRGVALIEGMCDRLRTPVSFRELAVIVARYHGLCHRALELRPAILVKLIEETDGLRRPGRFEKFLVACQADLRGRLGREDDDYPQAGHLRKAREAAAGVAVQPLLDAGLSGPDLGDALRARRIEAVSRLSGPAGE
jgi:tRNA nucleotidyltransferase (CCA-adding enzyme)